MSFYSDADFPMRPALPRLGGVTFKTTGNGVVGNVGAGVSFIGVSGGSLSFAYEGHFGEDLEENSVSARGSWPFWTGR